MVILAAHEQGSGPALVLLHPALESSRAFASQVDAFADAGFRVIALDLTGHGASPRFGSVANPWTRLKMASLTEDVEESLDALGVASYAFIGASLGGTIAQRIAVDRPEQVRAVVTVASPPTASVPFREYWRRAMTQEVPEKWSTHWRALHGAAYWRELREHALAYFSVIPDDAFPQEDLALYANPFLAIDPGDDPLYSPVQTMLWRAFVRQVEIERPEAGHDFWMDGADGTTWFNARVLRFLREALA